MLRQNCFLPLAVALLAVLILEADGAIWRLKRQTGLFFSKKLTDIFLTLLTFQLYLRVATRTELRTLWKPLVRLITTRPSTE